MEWLTNLNNAYPLEEFKPISSWIKKPMLIIGGLWDPHLKGAFDLYKKSLEAGGSPEIMIGNAIFASRVLKTSPAKIQNCIMERMVMISMQM